jgi:DNA modification methylase
MLASDQDSMIHHRDCIPFLAECPSHVFDFSVYSPPFPSVYSYTSLPEDIGNSEDMDNEVKIHFSFFFRQLLRTMKPGRVVVVHCTQIIRMKRSGFSGVFDFRGLLIRLAQRAGFIYEYDWQISKNPQSQAIRTRSRSLQFTGLESDRARSRGAMPDFLLVFSAPGDNAVPVDSPREVSRNDWIDWAESCWSWHEIRDTDTLNTAEAKGPEDVRHICPLQLAVIGRLIRLYSNPGEIVFSPFAGIGSEGYMALKLGRRFIGCEIKDEYVQTALKNLERAKRLREESEKTLFDLIPAVAESTTS